MKKTISIILAIMLFVSMIPIAQAEAAETAVHYTDASDPNYLESVEDNVYLSLIKTLDSDKYVVEDVRAAYISQEYLDELAYNSRVNVYFGYTLEEIEEAFNGRKFVFTLGDNNQTIVEEFQEYEDKTFETILKNVAIGTGVVLVFVTVSVVSAGIGAPAAVTAVFAYGANGAIIGAAAGAKFGALAGGIVKLVETGDVTDAFDAAVMSASEGFKWGAVSGGVTSAASETIWLKQATRTGLSMSEAAIIQQESNYPLELIRQLHDMEEYNVMRGAGLKSQLVNDKLALIRNDIDLNRLDEFGRTNLQRMLNGNAPLDSKGVPFELHHLGQGNGASLAILTHEEHATIPVFKRFSEIDRKAFAKERKLFWEEMANILSGGL